MDLNRPLFDTAGVESLTGSMTFTIRNSLVIEQFDRSTSPGGHLLRSAQHEQGERTYQPSARRFRPSPNRAELAFGAPASRTDSVCSGKNNARLKGLLTLG